MKKKLKVKQSPWLQDILPSLGNFNKDCNEILCKITEREVASQTIAIIIISCPPVVDLITVMPYNCG